MVTLVIGLTTFIGSTGQQAISMVVVDSVSKNRIPYATVIILRTGEGVLTTESGFFQMKVSDADEVRVSCVGYQAVVLSAMNLYGRDTILLAPAVRLMPEAFIKPNDWEAFRSKRLGVPRGKSNWHVGGKVGFEYSTLIKNPGLSKAYISQLHFKLRKPSSDTVVLRLHVYEVENGMPGAELLDNNEVEFIKGKVDALVSFDISSSKILFPASGLFVGIEWLGGYSLDSNAVMNSRASYPSLGFNEKSEPGLTMEREGNGRWMVSDLRKFYKNSTIENRAFSKDPPQATIGITVKYK